MLIGESLPIGWDHLRPGPIAAPRTRRHHEAQAPVSAAAMSAVPLTACPDCDLLQREPRLSGRVRVRCVRCGALLYRSVPGGLDRALAYAVAAAVLFLIANLSLMMGLDAQGNRTSATLLGAVRAVQDQHLLIVPLLVAMMGFAMPALEIGLTLYLLAVLRFWPGRRCSPLTLRLLHAVRPWSTIEVLVLGTLVSLGKLAQIAHVEIGPGLWAFGALMVVTVALTMVFDVRELAARVTWHPTRDRRA
jgi:paraquat-inducible protein A